MSKAHDRAAPGAVVMAWIVGAWIGAVALGAWALWW
jgi:hypothetical protein